jgi:hypothetical protein
VGANEPVGGGLDVGRAIDVVMNPAVSRPPMQPIEGAKATLLDRAQEVLDVGQQASTPLSCSKLSAQVYATPIPARAM